MVNNYLVGGWATYPSEKWWSESQIGIMTFPTIGEIKHVPKHQPAWVIGIFWE